MAKYNINQMTHTDMENNVSDYSVDATQLDSAVDQKETEYMNTNWSQQLGYYKKIPELQKAIQALAIWTAGKGWTATPTVTVTLDNIIGWGEDTFDSIIFNLLITKKIGGDSFAEIIRNKNGTLINLKPLNPDVIRVVVNRQGIILRYEQVNRIKGKNPKKFQPNEILHLCNDRVGDEIHGTSVIDACEWVILARNEAMADWKKVLHRNVTPFRIIEVESDKPAKLKQVKTEYQDVIDKGEVAVVPKGSIKINDSTAILQDSLATIKYYENFFYQAVGIPKIILGGSEEFTEASSKIGYLTFEQIYAREQTELQADLWQQCAIKIKFNKPASLQNEMLSDEGKDKEQGAVQPNDMTAGVGE